MQTPLPPFHCWSHLHLSVPCSLLGHYNYISSHKWNKRKKERNRLFLENSDETRLNSSSTGTHPSDDRSFLPQRATTIHWVAGERSGLASISQYDPQCGRWCSISMVSNESSETGKLAKKQHWIKTKLLVIQFLPLALRFHHALQFVLPSFSVGHSFLQSPACHPVHVWGPGHSQHWRAAPPPCWLAQGQVHQRDQRFVVFFIKLN